MNFIFHLFGCDGSKLEIRPCFDASTFNHLEIVQSFLAVSSQSPNIHQRNVKMMSLVSYKDLPLWRNEVDMSLCALN